MKPKELNKYAKPARDQGWTIQETKAGYRFVPPNKEFQKVQAYKSPSDSRWERNFLSQMRRSGFDWPPRKKGK
jgi:hypothetical protein